MQVDERFFWNKWMLEDLLNITCQVSHNQCSNSKEKANSICIGCE